MLRGAAPTSQRNPVASSLCEDLLLVSQFSRCSSHSQVAGTKRQKKEWRLWKMTLAERGLRMKSAIPVFRPEPAFVLASGLPITRTEPKSDTSQQAVSDSALWRM
jgi:hypothetical protein